MSDDLIFREVDEDLRQDRYRKIWRRWGRWVMAAAAFAVVATAGTVAWRDWQAEQRAADSARFDAADRRATDGDTAEALTAFEALAADGGTGYAMLARLREASLHAAGGDAAKAVATLDALAADGGIPQLYRDLANLLAALHGLETQDPTAVRARVAPLTADANPWRFTALEISALAALRQDDRAAARQLYQSLVDDPATPQGLRGRAARMAAALAG
ncbi:MAG: tetratricopeptide repeat protein [Alphaproteobacteria bacterium]|nr:tetratricopeptide repeat protein [Alphaproteobacteria bacterium]